MNGSPMSYEHGHPIRVVLPGISGSKWVKWLDRITIKDSESSNHYQRYDYRILPPEAIDGQTARLFWSVSPPLYDVPVNSVIVSPSSGETVNLDLELGSGSNSLGLGVGLALVKGYAVPHGADGPVKRVQVSGDGGETWVDAELYDSETEGNDASRKWCWVLWSARIPLSLGKGGEIVSRATDTGGNTQRHHSSWNLRGIGYNGYGRASGLTVV